MFTASNEPAVLLFPGALGDLCLALPTLRRVCARHRDGPCVLAVARWLLPLARTAMRDARVAAVRVAAVDDVALARMLGGGPRPGWWPPGAHLHAWMGADAPEVRACLAAHAETATFAHVVRGPGVVHAAWEYARAAGWDPTWQDLVRGAALLPESTTIPVEQALVLHRGAGAPAKRWGARHFALVASWWRRQGRPVVDLRGPADDDLAPLDERATVVRPTLGELAPTLAGAAAFVGADSGPAHVAAAVGAPSVVVYGPTDPDRWRPLGNRVVCHVGADGRRVIASLRALVPALP